MTNEEQQALDSIKFDDYKKRIVSASWSTHMETLMKTWGEKSAGLRFMHNSASDYWMGVSNKLSLCGIYISTVGAIISLVAANVDNSDTKNIALFTVGGISVISSVVQSLKKFYNADEKSAEHRSSAKQFGSFYRYMTLQMGMSSEERLPAGQLSDWALKEYERLQQDSRPLGKAQISLYKKIFKNANQAVPDGCEDTFEIIVYKSHDKTINEEEVEVEVE